MASKSLMEKIDALPVEKQAEVEHFVDTLQTQASRDNSEPGLVERLRLHRERMLRDHGLVDSVPLIRELREHGS